MDATRPAGEQGSASTGPVGAAAGALELMRDLRARALAFWELWPLLGVALISTLVYLQSAPLAGLPFDDSYISLQFARNLAAHGFLTFDGETASAGATSVLHVVILAVPIKLGVEPVKASLALGVLLHLGLVVAVYCLSWTIFRDRLAASLAAGSVAAVGYMLLDALNGMETTLFMLITTAAAAAFLGAKSDRATLLAGVLAALAVLTRPEGVLLAGAMVVYDAVDPARGGPLNAAASLRRLALLAGPSVVVLIGLTAYYGATTDSFTPGTATAKLRFFQEYKFPLVDKSRLLESGLGNFAAPLWPWLALAAFAARRRQTLLFAIFWLSFIAMYFWLFPGGITHYWYRYQHVFLPPLVVYGAAGAAFLARKVTFRSWEWAVGGAIGLVLLGFVALQYESFRSSYVGEIKLNEERQVATAKLLKQLVPPGGSIATHDIGAIGYFPDRSVIDLVGLVNPDVVKYNNDRNLREYVDRVRPDFIVVFLSWERNFLHLGLADDPQLFELVIPPDGTGNFMVYRTHYERPAQAGRE
ncbi:MAG: hypothetical protein WBD55_08085 [Dehalococcoidia bacterium]